MPISGTYLGLYSVFFIYIYYIYEITDPFYLVIDEIKHHVSIYIKVYCG